MQTMFFVGLDVHVKRTFFAVRHENGSVVAEGNTASVYKDVKAALEPYYSSCLVGMEASTSFYPLRDGFLQDEVAVKVANVLRIRQLVVKNDKLDARRLSDMLRLKTFPESFIPPKNVQHLRNLVTVRHAMLTDKNRTQARLWAACTRAGICLPVRSLFSQKGMLLLKSLVDSGKASRDIVLLISCYETGKMHLERATAELTSCAQATFPKESAKLQEQEGIGPIIAAYIIADVCPISRFASEKKLRRYAGVICCSRESGGKQYDSSLPKSSSRTLLRWALVQAAIHVMRAKGTTLYAYYQSKKNKGKQKAIMAVARQLSDKVFRLLSTT